MNSRVALGALLCFTAGLVPTARGATFDGSAPDTGRPFEVAVTSAPLYGIQPSSADPSRQRHIVRAADGTELYVEVWLPAEQNGNVPPDRIPTILVATPYQKQGTLESASTMEAMVPRGYAYAQLNVRGTGESGGCIDLYGPTEADDTARVIEWLGRDAPWSNGVVGGYGISYPGGTIVNAAGRGDPERTKYLKAVVVGAPTVDLYESSWIFDGVQSMVVPQLYNGQYFLVTSLALGETSSPMQLAQKVPCQLANLTAPLDLSGNRTPYYQARDNRPYATNINAATLLFHGHPDLIPLHGVPPFVEAGFFDRIPASTPHVGVFGAFGHELPSTHARAGVHSEWDRIDIDAMRIAWFDQYLKGIDAGADGWPRVQVQGTDGQWRAEASWPTTGGPAGQLALGAGGRLGVTAPSGSTRYLEGGFETQPRLLLPGNQAQFDTGPLPDRLELTGQPVLDLWVSLLFPDAHIAARIDTFGPDGEPIALGSTYGLRSAQHLDPLVDGRFVQGDAKWPPTMTPLRVQVRFQPTDLVVPKGGRLRLTISGSLIVNSGLDQLGVNETTFRGPSLPSGVIAPVTILHDCAHPSALRFLQPSAQPDLLNVRERDEPAGTPLADNRPFVPPVSDAGGLTVAPVCGQPPFTPAP